MLPEQEPPIMDQQCNAGTPETFAYGDGLAGAQPAPESTQQAGEADTSALASVRALLDMLRISDKEQPVYTATKITTGSEKAAAASRLRNTMISLGFSEEQAGNMAIHELKHALKDKGKPGDFGFQTDSESNRSIFFYQPRGLRTFREHYESYVAPGKDMSPVDKAGAFISYHLMFLDPVIEFFRKK